MLEDLIEVSTILSTVRADDWQDAIVQAVTPLVDSGKVERRYIDAIINSVNANGPYFVLAPHIALPHARPEEGVIQDAIGIAILENPVVFGSKANDPVKYMFTLCATSNGKHLDSLAQLAVLMEDSKFFELLDQHPDAMEIIDYIVAKGKEE